MVPNSSSPDSMPRRMASFACLRGLPDHIIATVFGTLALVLSFVVLSRQPAQKLHIVVVCCLLLYYLVVASEASSLPPSRLIVLVVVNRLIRINALLVLYGTLKA
ncbi:predicted protein [Pyrenophora tritici-repentis Pt-1C-BFP]|uniref:Uncharacterized protein n=1 Tax=Pyrenophora tritici-repentis (strain Pt-1C-BFP) TaxID=426418 RepID=B2W4X3_PYRTR|nr:uncharacterized protein PTRG_04673 [Pyrenophora tritici-repentis Pt-1C-BFP]EDU47580.1 predicted protein [Pyrenophora tritici-repentis Pt-1C-BFP]